MRRAWDDLPCHAGWPSTCHRRRSASRDIRTLIHHPAPCPSKAGRSDADNGRPAPPPRRGHRERIQIGFRPGWCARRARSPSSPLSAPTYHVLPEIAHNSQSDGHSRPSDPLPPQMAAPNRLIGNDSHATRFESAPTSTTPRKEHQVTSTTTTRSALVRAKLTHPIVDGAGHAIEYTPTRSCCGYAWTISGSTTRSCTRPSRSA